MNIFKIYGVFIKGALCALSLIYSMNGYAGTLTIWSYPPDLVAPTPSAPATILLPILPPIISITPITPITPITLDAPLLNNQLVVFELTPIKNAINWEYSFAFGAPAISLTLPLFSDTSISGIVNPTDWSFSTGTTDIFGLGSGAGYMKWTYTGTASPLIGMFSFQSLSAPTYAPYKFLLSDGTTYNYSGFMPSSALSLAAGFQPYVSPVPEAETYIMLLAGLCLMAFVSRRKKA